jgi:cyclopropane fatty-acyl-phospholipid synthase-like methyltransferase
MKKNPMTNHPFHLLGIYIVLVLVIQIVVTYGFTNTKVFSLRALIRNLSILIPIVYGIQYIWVPILLEITVEFFKYHGYFIEKYMATIYMYNDYFREMNKKYPILSNYTEGIYDGLLGIDTTDLSQENLKKVRDWGQKIYYESFKNPSPYFTDLEGNRHDKNIKYETERRKFELICKKCNVQKGMKILEIGFGECDFLQYIRKEYGIDTVGVSISKEQVKNAKELGFEAHCLDMWDITEEIGHYDLVIQCGNLEYARVFGEKKIKYKDYATIIKQILNPNGKYFITCCHVNEKYLPYEDYSLSDFFKAYILWSGNDGCYPVGSDGFTKHATQVGFKVVYQEDRTLDYYIAMILYFSFLRCTEGKCHNILEPFSFMKALFLTIAAPYYIHTYVQLQGNQYLPVAPFAWEFEPQFNKNKGKFDVPITLQYILLQL